MDDTRKERGVPLVSGENWLQYFRSLHSNERLNPARQTICNELGENERHGQESRPLDYPINENKICKAAKKLKNNKSPFSDKIRNEMMKASIDTLMPVYYKLSILRVGTMPRTRCGGLFTIIYKAGGRSDPANYRGICVSSCLGKLFCSILNQRLIDYVASLNILHKSQIGFLPTNRTTDHVYLQVLIYSKLHEKNHVITC